MIINAIRSSNFNARLMQNWGAPLDEIRSTILNSTHRKLRRQKRRKRPKKFEKDTEEGISLRAGRENRRIKKAQPEREPFYTRSGTGALSRS